VPSLLGIIVWCSPRPRWSENVFWTKRTRHDMKSQFSKILLDASQSNPRSVQGRNSVHQDYVEALLYYKIVVVTQRDTWEDHFRIGRGRTSLYGSRDSHAVWLSRWSQYCRVQQSCRSQGDSHVLLES